jgi:hypothetical protein
LRNAARNWQGRLVLTVGDLLVGRHEPDRWEVIVGGVTADLKWLSERCDSVALIAHSHGAVIAAEVLSRSAPPNVALLITYGTVSRMFNHSADGGTDVADYWLDFVAASDPFAGRPMPATATGRGLRIHGQGSFVTAHWAYWRSTQQFALPIASALMAIGEKPLQRRAYEEDNARHELCLFARLARPHGGGHSTALACAAQA